MATTNVAFKDDPEWGVPAARFNLRIARLAADRLSKNPTDEQRDEWYLYYGAFLTFLWASLQALKNYDGKRDLALGKTQETFFRRHIEGSVEWEVIRQERHIVGHALPAGACHPEQPIDVLERRGGLESLFDGFPGAWPDGPLKGRPIPEGCNMLLRKVSDWIDAVEAEDRRKKGA